MRKPHRVELAVSAGAAVILAVVVALIVFVANTKTTPGTGVINETSAVFLGFQTLATVMLASLTFMYVRSTRALVDEAIEERHGRDRERREMLDRQRRSDLDETRRLAYMALIVGKAGQVDLAATLVNALVHHQGVSLDDALAHVPTVLNNGQGDYPSAQWLQGQVDRITAELESAC